MPGWYPSSAFFLLQRRNGAFRTIVGSVRQGTTFDFRPIAEASRGAVLRRSTDLDPAAQSRQRDGHDGEVATPPTTSQKLSGSSLFRGTTTFMPSNPAMTEPGSSSTVAIVRTFMISFVRWAVRVMYTSNDPRSASRLDSIEPTAARSAT